MIVAHVSPPAGPADRGEALGAAFVDAISRTSERYAQLFGAVAGGPADLESLGAEALRGIEAHAPEAAAEIRGIAGGAGLEPHAIALLNARTEVLARLGAQARGECSTVVALGPAGARPVSMQTWDWHDLFADGWFVWTIEHPDGTVVHTVTEYGILGKIGVNSHGVGLHFNILHHDSDGGPFGLPLHLLARRVLDTATDPGQALATLGAAQVSASSVLTVVAASGAGKTGLSAELSPVGPRFVAPSPDGLLLHTNHFLAPQLAAGDREPRIGPDSFLRMDVLTRALAGAPAPDRDTLLAAMTSHVGGAGAVCCHPDPDAPLGDRWETLATIALDVAAGTMDVRKGGPCDAAADWFRPTSPTTVRRDPAPAISRGA